MCGKVSLIYLKHGDVEVNVSFYEACKTTSVAEELTRDKVSINKVHPGSVELLEGEKRKHTGSKQSSRRRSSATSGTAVSSIVGAVAGVTEVCSSLEKF